MSIIVRHLENLEKTKVSKLNSLNNSNSMSARVYTRMYQWRDNIFSLDKRTSCHSNSSILRRVKKKPPFG